MQVIRIRKRGKGPTERFMVHATVAGRTFCGLHVEDLDVVLELEVEKMPALEGCLGCLRVADGWVPRTPRNSVALSPTAPSAPGRLRKTGPLAHGTRIQRGSPLR